MVPLLLAVLAALCAVLYEAVKLVLANEYATWAPKLARVLTRAAGFICRPRCHQWLADIDYVQLEEKGSGLIQATSCFFSSPVLAIRYAVARLQLRTPQLAAAEFADAGIASGGPAVAALRQRVGSMWSVYATLVIVAIWMALGIFGSGFIDRYPFPLMVLLGSTVQLLLCFVIMVGQRVISRAADQQAVQTHSRAEAIFQQVAQLQHRLDRQGRELSRGLSLLEAQAHPWIEQHHVQRPPLARDQAVTINGRIADSIAQRFGSMWTFWTVAALQALWIGLAQMHYMRFDGYPYPFLLLLSSLLLLVLMFLIVVRQNVLSGAADRRYEQMYFDADAILYECKRMEAQLTVHDRIIRSLSEYATTQIAERLSRAIHDTWARSVHEAYVEAHTDEEETYVSRAALHSWDELSDVFKESNRTQARHVGEKLRALGCVIVPAFDPSLSFEFDDREVEQLAEMEHERWMHERIQLGYRYGSVRKGHLHPDLIPWTDLSEEAREKDRHAVRSIPAMLAAVGFQVLRVTVPGPISA